MRYEPINPELFRLNRKRFSKLMKPDSIAIFHSNDLMPRNGDTFFPFKQNSDLFYLSGLDQEESMLVLFPDCIKENFRELIFIKHTDEKTALWEGKKYSKEEARLISGVERVYWLEDLPIILHELVLLAENIYLNTNEQDNFHSKVVTHNLRHIREMKDKYPLHQFCRSQPLLKQMAMIKSSHEVRLIEKAIDITNKAFRRTLGFIQPGVMEYEIEAEITHEFISNRANGHAYAPIIASGPNTCVLHYTMNTRKCQAGELILMDFGAEYANYASDITRTLPVSGKFTNRQRNVYEAVLRILRQATQLLVPGNTLEDLNQKVGLLMQEELLELGLLKPYEVKNQNQAYPAYKYFFMHSVSHHLGRDVHDLSSRYMPFQAGMILTVEPGIYIRKENIGIRLENIVLITDDSPINLAKDIPIEVEEIENLMNVEIFNS